MKDFEVHCDVSVNGAEQCPDHRPADPGYQNSVSKRCAWSADHDKRYLLVASYSK